MSVKVNTASASTVYHGPSSSIYASVGSVGIEQVEVFAVEKTGSISSTTPEPLPGKEAMSRTTQSRIRLL